MDTLQSTIPLGKIEDENVERSFFDDAGTSWDIASLSFGDGVDIASRQSTFAAYPDYKDNEKSYKAYEDMSVWYRSASSEKLERQLIDKAIDENKFTLDANGNLAPGENASPITMFMFDNDAVKGGILARNNGWDKKIADQSYIDETAKQAEALAVKAKGSSTAAKITGTLAGYMFRQETALEVATSPAKVVGSSILGGMGKAFVTEFAIGAFGETLRESSIREHMAKANLDYTLWDSAKNILIGAGLAGSLRAIGSGAVDANILRKVDSAGLDATDKEILNRYFRREQYKLTTNSRANLELLQKAEDDINKGKQVDVSDHTDIDIETKTDADIEANSMPDLIAEEQIAKGTQKQIDDIQADVDNTKPLEFNDEDIYDGMATPQEADEVIMKMGDIDPEIKAEMEAIEAERTALVSNVDERRSKKISPQAQKVKDAAVPEIGAEIDAEKQAVKNLFLKNTSDEARYKGMSKEDVEEMNRMDIEDSIKAMEADGVVFAKGADNVAAGVAASVEVDDEGNISIDPEKFVLGLGGYSALKALAKSPKVQAEFKGYIERTLDDLEAREGSQFITGKQNIIAYHGSPNSKIDKFDIEKSGDKTIMTQQGPGIYFTDEHKQAAQYAKPINKISGGSESGKVYKVDIDLKTPIKLTQKRTSNINKEDAVNLYINGDNDYFFNSWIKFDLGKSRLNGSETKEELVRKYIDYLGDDNSIMQNIVRAYKNKETQFSNMKKFLKADGVEYTDSYGKILVAWDNEQIKMLNEPKGSN